MLKRIVKSQKITIITVQQWVREKQSTSTILFHIFALAQHYWLYSQNCPSLKLTLHYCVTYDIMFTDVFSVFYWTWPQFLLLTLCRLPNTETSKCTLHPHSTSTHYAMHDCTAQSHRRKQATVYVVTACHSTDAHTHDFNDCYSLWVDWVLRLANSERHWNCTVHFRYRGIIEYRNTWDGIVIVAPISGIAQQ